MHIINAIIETPRGSLAKYSYDQFYNCYKLKKILPPGLSFPYDFGFIPNTKGEDGDPIDIIVFNEHPTFPGCMIECKLIGAFLAEQSEGKKTIRNDRLLGVATLSKLYEDLTNEKKLVEEYIQAIEQFFVDYNQIEGKKFKPLKVIGAEKAFKLFLSEKEGKATG